MKTIFKTCAMLSLLFILFLPSAVSAEIKSFIKEYTYQAGDEDSKNSSRVIALREVKRLLQEELGSKRGSADALAYYGRALAAAAKGDVQKTVQDLKIAFKLNPGYKVSAQNEEGFAAVRSHPEFVKLTK